MPPAVGTGWRAASRGFAAPLEMSVVRLARHGGPETLELWQCPAPACEPDEVLVRVAAAGVNPVDCKTRAGAGVAALNPLPTVLGWDVSGTVVAVGEAADEAWIGQRVFAMPQFPNEAGCYAEYVAVPVDELAPAPRSLALADAAALPLAGLTALQALTEHARVRRGDRVLIHAGAGGVGHLAIQVAKILGAHVVATASAANLAYLRELGADEAVDYRAGPFEREIEPVVVAVDAIGGDVGRRTAELVVPGGRLIALSDDPDPELADARAIVARRMRVHPDGEGLARLARLVDGGRLQPTIAARLPLEQAAEAHALVESRRLRGKALLTVGG